MTLDRRLIFVALHASDLRESTRFYRDLIGIPLKPGKNEPQDDPWMGGEHAELSWHEGSYLHFSLFPANPPHRTSTKAVQLGFRVEDVDRLHRQVIQAGVTVLHAPRDEPWGRTARYKDPDGNIVNITAR